VAASVGRVSEKTPSKQQPPRRILQQGGRQLEIIGVNRPGLRDFYHFMVGASWSRVLLIFVGFFLGANVLFATLYTAVGGINGAREGSFADAFFFSVQTLGTIGYGVMAPQTLTSHLIVTVETMTGMLSMAITTGLVFAKFSRPTARVLFSKVACIGRRDGVPTLTFRVANERANGIVEATLKVAMLRTEVTKEGEVVRKLVDLPLVRSTSPAFTLSWTAMHPVVPGSPLYGMTEEDFRRHEAQIFVSLTGLDETLAQTIHARYVYSFADLRWEVRFADVMVEREGRRVIDYTLFHEVVPVDVPSINSAIPVSTVSGAPAGAPPAIKSANG